MYVVVGYSRIFISCFLWRNRDLNGPNGPTGRKCAELLNLFRAVHFFAKRPFYRYTRKIPGALKTAI